jgi:threonine/homoserine/homoserine lactone efflux protein
MHNVIMGGVFGQITAVLPQFTVACLVLALLPGPSTALLLHRTLRDGRRAGLAAVAGNEIGVFCWVMAAGAGLTALLRANAVLFAAMHVIGGIVLMYLGVSAWRNARRDDSELGADPPRLAGGRGPLAAFRASLVSITANPKAAVWAFSFFPQFLPHHGSVLGATATLGAIQVVIDGSYCAGLVLAAAGARHWLSRAAVRRRMERVLGATLIGLGIDLAAATR